MISALAGLMLQAVAPLPAPPAPPPPPPPPRSGRMEPARARANLASLISNEDYPGEALRNDEQGTVGFRLHVGPDGRVAGCDVTSSSGSASLDSTTCRILTARARFSPARDRRGRPTTDTVSARIVWRIEASQAFPVAAMAFVESMRATPAGEVTCTDFVNGQAAQGPPCSPDLARRMGAAARAAGREMGQTIVRTITPSGEAERSERGDEGTQIVYAEAAVDIAPDGSILQCRIVRNEALGPAVGSSPPGDPCLNFRTGDRRFEPATGAGRPRTIVFRARVYVRR